MSKGDDDILIDIPDEDVPELYRMYQKHLEWAPQVCCAIDSGIKWRNKTEDDSMIFVSPNNSWKEDGTFLILMRLSPGAYGVFVFTLDEECMNLYKGLMETNRIDYKGRARVLFFAVSHRHYQTVKRVADIKILKPLFIVEAELFYIPREEALQFDVSLPDDEDVYMDRLKPSDSSKIHELWPHRYYGSAEAIERLIEINGGLGMYLRGTRELIGWVLLGWLGQVALLVVVKEHARKGYAALLTRALSKEIARANQVPYGTIVTRNTPSVNLFKKLTFRSLGLTYFVSVLQDRSPNK